jgi:hypothetical protein
MPLAQVTFICRLPVASSAGYGGFVTFPAGTFTKDPSAPAGGISYWNSYYDRAVSAWVPVARQAVAPDGLHYAFATGDSPSPWTVHLVSAIGGSQRTIAITDVPGNGPPDILDYSSDAIYFFEGFEGNGTVWRLELASGAVTKVADGAVEAIAGGALWLAANDPADPRPPAGRSGAYGDSLIREDLSTHQSEPWFKRLSARVTLAGVDGTGAAVVQVEILDASYAPVSLELWTVMRPGQEHLIYSLSTPPPGVQLDGYVGGMIADDHGLWFGGSNGIFLYASQTGMQRVSDVDGFPANGCA